MNKINEKRELIVIRYPLLELENLMIYLLCLKDMDLWWKKGMQIQFGKL